VHPHKIPPLKRVAIGFVSWKAFIDKLKYQKINQNVQQTRRSSTNVSKYQMRRYIFRESMKIPVIPSWKNKMNESHQKETLETWGDSSEYARNWKIRRSRGRCCCISTRRSLKTAYISTESQTTKQKKNSMRPFLL
jgi:hypothetical protein